MYKYLKERSESRFYQDVTFTRLTLTLHLHGGLRFTRPLNASLPPLAFPNLEMNNDVPQLRLLPSSQAIRECGYQRPQVVFPSSLIFYCVLCRYSQFQLKAPVLPADKVTQTTAWMMCRRNQGPYKVAASRTCQPLNRHQAEALIKPLGKKAHAHKKIHGLFLRPTPGRLVSHLAAPLVAAADQTPASR
jgi:hypothetical protein